MKKTKPRNLWILTVNEDGGVYYEVNKEIIMDNYSSYKTEKLMKFYADNKINILFNAPYLSKFNPVELAFRNLKRNLYTNTKFLKIWLRLKAN